MKKVIKIIGDILIICILLILAVIIYLNIMYSLDKEKIPSIGGHRMLTVLSGSMRPVLEPGDIIIIKDNTHIDEGDIITFKSNNLIITHRVIEVISKENEVLYKTKGDNNNVEDKILIKQDNILGEYLFRIPYLGYLMQFFRSKLGIMIIVTIIGLLVIFEVIKSFTDKKE
ncbi:signal peptidase I [Oceanirhabdus sp. W0125-5]|uniref:signal peptidase I n=1 Tax=Oceanirhabdus sp. W0125-5 TaxID=2999116 RepID=UPI0022F2FD5A|nr:signal peptidase I [Oceanirhabdus sp. W0125-5]WBW98275.1 signal peptidase I [Oceanirhabdus sp. W0125-5]